MSKRTYVIGDLHGCYDEAVDLLDKLAVSEGDRVIFTGDLVDRGPDNDKCVELAMRYESVMGNHEETHIRYVDDDREPMSPTHVATRKQLRQEHYDYFRRMPLSIRLPEHNAVVVHAGVLPWRTFDQQEPYHLLHVQMVRPFDENMQPCTRSKWPSKVRGEPGWNFWSNLWRGPERVIFGHSVLDKPLLTDFVAGVDGGACWGRELWALDVDAWSVTSVPARKPNPKAERLSYRIHGDVYTY